MELSAEQIDIIEYLLKRREQLPSQYSLFNIDFELIKQDIRIRFFNKIHLYDSNRPFRHWANKVINRQWFNGVRNQITFNQKAAATNYEWHIGHCVNSDFFFPDNVKNIQKRFIDALGPLDKRIFNLRFEWNDSPQEIAYAIGYSRRQVYNRINAMKRMLQKSIDKEEMWF